MPRPSRTSRNPRAAERRGFTLIELLAVMALLSVLMGLTVGVLGRAAQPTKLDTAWRLVRNALAEARVSAREQGALSRVVIAPGPPTPRILLRRGREAGSWHFDEAKGSEVLGGRNNVAKLLGAQLVDGGTVRKCAEFGSGQVAVCEPATIYDPTEGFVLAMDIKPEGELGAGTIASFGSVFTFDLAGDGSLSATLDVDADQAMVSAKTPPQVIAPDRWARVELSYDGIEVLIRAHGVLEARKKIVSELTQAHGLALAKPGVEDRLTFGGKGYKGLIDEVTYKTLEAVETIDLDPAVEIAVQGAREIRFDAEGRLDPRIHDALVEIPLALEGEGRKLVVDLSGVVR